jgi:hypothetical protein
MSGQLISLISEICSLSPQRATSPVEWVATCTKIRHEKKKSPWPFLTRWDSLRYLDGMFLVALAGRFRRRWGKREGQKEGPWNYHREMPKDLAPKHSRLAEQSRAEQSSKCSSGTRGARQTRTGTGAATAMGTC